MTRKTEPTIPESYVALRTEFIEPYHKGRHRAPVEFKVGMTIKGKEYLVSSNGFAIGVPASIVEDIKERLVSLYRLISWEVLQGTNEARLSRDFDLADAEVICSTLTPMQLDYFLAGEDRSELSDLKIVRGQDADF